VIFYTKIIFRPSHHEILPQEFFQKELFCLVISIALGNVKCLSGKYDNSRARLEKYGLAGAPDLFGAALGGVRA
jgi:hypothetical protein